MDLSILSKPIKISNHKAPNRPVNHPMKCNDADSNKKDVNLK